ncbi:MAG: TetR/AcrR family transcriptional regulator [Actinomycetota bacterium]|nr:TetR/AcrR family transcriptional regulator [Actinomycetota bacterium]
MTTLRTARDRARAEVQAEILAMARQHLAEHGSGGLSLRAVARDLDLVPSAVYRYFENRDVLLTAMIVEAYDALGDAAEGALAKGSRRRPVARWVGVAKAIREWAVEHPHEYSLLYGTPVPGYAAPQDTVAPGTRVSLALVQVVVDAWSDGLVAAPATTLSAGTRRDFTALVDQVAAGLPAEVAFRTILAWTQLFGLLSFELFSQTRGLVEHHAQVFADAASTMARQIGLAE